MNSIEKPKKPKPKPKPIIGTAVYVRSGTIIYK